MEATPVRQQLNATRTPVRQQLIDTVPVSQQLIDTVPFSQQLIDTVRYVLQVTPFEPSEVNYNSSKNSYNGPIRLTTFKGRKGIHMCNNSTNTFIENTFFTTYKVAIEGGDYKLNEQNSTIRICSSTDLYGVLVKFSDNEPSGKICKFMATLSIQHFNEPLYNVFPNEPVAYICGLVSAGSFSAWPNDHILGFNNILASVWSYIFNTLRKLITKDNTGYYNSIFTKIQFLLFQKEMCDEYISKKYDSIISVRNGDLKTLLNEVYDTRS